LLDSAANVLRLRWDRDLDFAELFVDLQTANYRLDHSSAQGVREWTFASSAPQPDFIKTVSA
jgi:hypothetical protein